MLEKDILIIKIILEYSLRISNKIRNVSINEFGLNEDLQNIISFCLLQIGELTNKLSEELKKGNNDLPWHLIIGMRNRIVHGYANIDFETVYETSKTNIPELITFCEKILKENS